jgi:putative copper export protein/methionine-rich copper-binding protein CopC
MPTTAHPARPARGLALLLLTALVALLGLLAGASSASATPVTPSAPVASMPAANAIVRTSPSMISIDTSATSGTATVFAADHRVVARGALAPTARGLQLGLPAPGHLRDGVYSVVWSAGGREGTFAFQVHTGAGAVTPVGNPAPPTPLGPFEDGAVAWTTWVTLMGLVGLVVLALVLGRPARRGGAELLARTTTRLTRAAAVAAVLAVPAVLTDVAHGAAGDSGGYDYGAAWSTVFDGTDDGRLIGIELVGVVVALALLLPLTVRRGTTGRARTGLLGGALAAGAVALGTTKFPDEMPEQWGRTIFETLMWMLHLLGGATWIGGLLGLALLALPGGVPAEARGAFWSPAIRRFSVAAMACVGAIALSGLWLYWEHVDGPTQLLTTMYGRVLGVKILIFGALLLLGAVNQFWLHPKIEALRAAGDERPLRAILTRDFRITVAVEVLLGAAVLMVAPFLHGSARNQAFQAHGARLTTTAPSGVSFTPSGLQPGLTAYTVRVPDGRTHAVTVAFTSSALGVPTRTATARPTGDGSYRVTGLYTPQVGDWSAAVSVDAAAAATFDVPITAEQELAKLPAKTVSASTWAYGTLETLAVIAVMIGGFVASGRLAQRRRTAVTVG